MKSTNLYFGSTLSLALRPRVHIWLSVCFGSEVSMKQRVLISARQKLNRTRVAGPCDIVPFRSALQLCEWPVRFGVLSPLLYFSGADSFCPQKPVQQRLVSTIVVQIWRNEVLCLEYPFLEEKCLGYICPCMCFFNAAKQPVRPKINWPIWKSLKFIQDSYKV